MAVVPASTAPTSGSFFGEQIKTRRERLGLSQIEIAELVQEAYARRKGIELVEATKHLRKPTRFDIIRWEKGQAPRDQDMLAALAEVLGANVDDLLRPEHALAAREKALIHQALEPLVDTLYELLRQRIEEE